MCASPCGPLIPCAQNKCGLACYFVCFGRDTQWWAVQELFLFLLRLAICGLIGPPNEGRSRKQMVKLVTRSIRSVHEFVLVVVVVPRVGPLAFGWPNAAMATASAVVSKKCNQNLVRLCFADTNCALARRPMDAPVQCANKFVWTE